MRFEKPKGEMKVNSPAVEHALTPTVCRALSPLCPPLVPRSGSHSAAFVYHEKHLPANLPSQTRVLLSQEATKSRQKN
eukprot:scaffold143635_cov130-Phaeocystis_antarctica.AAC.1